MKSRFFPAVLLWAAAFILVGLTLREIDLAGVRRALGSLDFTGISVLALVNLFILGLMTLRWWLVLKEFGHPVGFFRLAGYRLAGFGLSYFTPGPQVGGEPLQILLLRRKENLPAGAALASVFLDRLSDMLANFTFLAFGLTLLSLDGMFGGSPGRWGWIPASLAALLPAFYMLALRRGRRPLGILAAFLSSRTRSTRVSAFGVSLSQAEEQIGLFMGKNLWTQAWIAFVSAGIWAAVILELYLLLSFLGLSVDLRQVIVILTVTRVAFLLPLPGALGVLEAGMVLSVGWAGFDPSYGMAASLVIRARDVSLGGAGLFLGIRAAGGLIFSRDRNIYPGSPDTDPG